MSAMKIVYTPKLSGVNANFIAQSLRDHGLDLASMTDHGPASIESETNEQSKLWRDIWSAGHGVGAVRDIPAAAELVTQLRTEFREATRRLASIQTN